MKFRSFGALAVLSSTLAAGPDYFTPEHRLNGIGADRGEITPAVLEARIARMVQSQTFAIMREPQATAGAERITSPKLARIFRNAAAASGIPVSLISAIAYLESWGDAQTPLRTRSGMQTYSPPKGGGRAYTCGWPRRHNRDYGL